MTDAAVMGLDLVTLVVVPGDAPVLVVGLFVRRNPAVVGLDLGFIVRRDPAMLVLRHGCLLVISLRLIRAVPLKTGLGPRIFPLPLQNFKLA